MNNKSDIFHSKNYLFLNFLILLGYLCLYPLITSKLSPYDYGNYIFAHSVAVIIVGISNFGVKIGYKRNFFEFYNKKKESEILLFSVQIFVIIIFISVFIINFIFKENITSYFGAVKNIKNFWLLLLLGLMFESFSKYYLIFLENRRESQKYFYLIFFKSIIYFILVLFFLFNNYGLKSLIYSLLMSNFILFCFVIFFQLKNKYFRFNKTYMKDVLKISLPNTPKILFGQINSKADKILISTLSTFSNTGIYSIAQSLSYVIFQIINSLDKVFITKTNKMLFDKQNYNIGPFLTSFIYFCSIPAIGLIYFNELIMEIFIDKKYHGSENIIIILVIYYFSLIFGKISGTQLIYAKKIWLNTNFFILNIFLNIIFNIPLIYYFNMLGAAVATLLSSSISLLFSMYFAKKYSPIHYERKQVSIIFGFILLSSVYSILVSNQFLEVNLIFDQFIGFAVILLFIIHGYLQKIYDQNTLKSIFRILKKKRNVKTDN
jgi:O-antigen/teichoic acid export membrane protein